METLVLFLILEGKLLVFHLWELYALWAFPIWPLLCWHRFLLWPFFEDFFFHKWMLNFIWIYWDDYMVFIFQFGDMVYHFGLHILKNPCSPGINLNWSWCMSFLMCCWIPLLEFCWGILHLCSSVTLACNLLFSCCFFPGFGIRVIVAL